MRPSRFFRLLRRAAVGWWNDDVSRLGASVAYYTLFAIAPILLVVIAVAGMVFGAEAVRGQVVGQIQGLLGHDGALAVQGLLQAARHRGSGILATIIGSVTFIIAATGAFLELQTAINTIWRIKPEPNANVRQFIGNRLRALGLLLGVGFLLLVSLAVSAALAAVGGWIGARPMGTPWLWTIVNIVISFMVVTLLFALLFKFLPDAELRWRDLWTGSIVTAILFSIGKEVIGLYLGQGSVASSYGAAGSVMVVLLWVYYAAQILLFGAEFVRAETEDSIGSPPASRFAHKTTGSTSH